MSAFLQIFQLMLGQKNAKSPWWRHSWTSVFHYLDPSLPLLKSGHKKLQARVLVNLFSMVKPNKNYITHAWHISIVVGLLGRSSCSSPVVNLLIKQFTTLESSSQENCQYYNSSVVIYDRKMFIRLATELREIPNLTIRTL